MDPRPAALALATLLGLAAPAAAGPIQFQLGPGQPTASPWEPARVAALLPILPPGPVYGFDPTAGQPARVELLTYDPSRLPTPAPRDIHPDGTTHWNTDGYFGLDVWLTDVNSGESATLRFTGRAHMYSTYSTRAGWGGLTYFWFQDVATAKLGGNDYTVWGTNWYDKGPAAVNVWVGPNPPVHLAPEPGTLLLGLLALLPAGLRPRSRKSI